MKSFDNEWISAKTRVLGGFSMANSNQDTSSHLTPITDTHKLLRTQKIMSLMTDTFFFWPSYEMYSFNEAHNFMEMYVIHPKIHFG